MIERQIQEANAKIMVHQDNLNPAKTGATTNMQTTQSEEGDTATKQMELMFENINHKEITRQMLRNKNIFKTRHATVKPTITGQYKEVMVYNRI